MSTLKFTNEHEYIEIDGDIGTVGITDFAQGQLGDVVFVELPDVGREIAQGDEIAVVESVKAASEIFAPVAGEIVAINDALEGNPGTVNESAESDGWFFKIRLADKAELDGLMDREAYKTFVEENG